MTLEELAAEALRFAAGGLCPAGDRDIAGQAPDRYKKRGRVCSGAFAAGDVVGFVLSVPAFSVLGERAFYSHMTAVKKHFQGRGVGASLKWVERERALAEGVKYVKWTFEPWKARNAFFNLEKLGVVIRDTSRTSTALIMPQRARSALRATGFSPSGRLKAKR